MENYNYNISVNKNTSLKIFRGDIFILPQMIKKNGMFQ